MTKSRKNWIRSLKVGDYVCDVRYYHLKIMHIDDYFANKVMPFKSILFFPYFPEIIGDKVYDAWSFVCRKFDLKEIYDKALILEDGSTCFASVCEPANHSSKHPGALNAI